MLDDYQLWQRDYLLRISRAMTSQLDLRGVLRLILESAIELVGGKIGLIALADRDGSFKIQASYGLSARMIPLIRPLFQDLPSLNETLEFKIPDLERRLQMVMRAIGISPYQVVALPMIIDKMLVGVIYVLRQSAFTFADRRALSAFAGQAAIAVHNARLYQQVSQEKRRLDAILENSGDGVMLLDADLEITVFNRALTIMTGIPAEEAIGRPCAEVLVLHDPNTQESAPELTCPLDRCLEGEQVQIEGDFLREDTIRITLGITYSPLFDSEGHLVNVIANVRDITHFREAEEMKSTITHFREAEEMKSTFISVISHELKTPVALIKGYAGTLRRPDAEWDTETIRESMGIIEEESDRLAELIENLLDASRLQAGQMMLEKQEVSLDHLAARIVQQFRTQTSRHTFELDFAPGFPEVQADPERLRQVLNNLLSNAIKYSPDSGKIIVSGRYDDQQVYVAVSDQGIGIPAGERDRIFDRFYRVDSALSRRTQGAGLGLYLAKSVVEAHRGRIWVSSSPGQGSTFVFSLPRDPSRR
jgi:PAS domain S-box-containing protein